MKRSLISVILAALLLPINAISPAQAADGPTLSWTSPAEGSNAAGMLRLRAAATPLADDSSFIAQWCLTLDGQPIDQNVGEFSNSNLNFNASLNNSGCWSSSSSYYDMRSALFTFDTTKWANKTYSFAIKVTDSSGRESSVATLNIVVGNAGPTLSWNSPANGSNAAGVLKLKATAAPSPSGTSYIAQWCLTLDGQPIDQNVGEFSNSNLNFNASLNNSGCWSSSSSYYDMRSALFTFDTTKWANKTYSFAIKVTDSSGRESSVATLNIVVGNAGPTLSWNSPANGSNAAGVLKLKATAAPSPSGTSYIAQWCSTLDGQPIDQNVGEFSNSNLNFNASLNNSGCWSSSSSYYDMRSALFTFDTTKWANKTYSFAIKVTDSSGRESSVATLNIVVGNAGPTLSWNSPANGSNAAGVLKLKATAAPSPSGTSYIAQWCLTLDGQPIDQNVGEFSNSNLNFNASLNNSGCWSSSSSYYDMRSALFTFDTTKWANKTYSFAIKVTDSSERSSEVQTLTVNVLNPGPTAKLTSSAQQSSSGNFKVEATATPYSNIPVFTWCVDASGVPNAKLNPTFKGTDGGAVEASPTSEQNCWTSEEELRTISLSVLTAEVVNGTYSLKVWAVDENNHMSDQVVSTLVLNDPGVTMSLTPNGSLTIPSNQLQIILKGSGSGRTVKSVDWKINGKNAASSSEPIYSGPTNVFKAGSNTVVAVVTDSIGNVATLKGTYTVKWAPLISVPEIKNYSWYIPANPSFKVRVTLLGKPWSGTVSLAYQSASGSTTQSIKVSGGVGNVTMKTIRVDTKVVFSIASSSTTQATSFTDVVSVQVRPPDPIVTKISVRAPASVTWPNSFNFSLSLTGKGRYSCTAYFQRRYVNFSVYAGNTVQVNVQPTDGINRSEVLRGSCIGPAGSTRTYFETNLAVVVR